MYNEKNCYSIHGLPVLQDNIVWILVRANEALVVDPSVAKPVEEWLHRKNLNLIGILQTHHHEDHIGGTEGLLNSWPNAEIVASKTDLKRIPFQTKSVVDMDELLIMGCHVKVLEVAGHTSTHLAYFIQSQKDVSSNPLLFCGDTLFSAGCGRIFEGTIEQLYKSIQLLNELPKETKVYCAHEYTESNLRWALTIKPNDKSINSRLIEVEKRRSKGLLSLPSSLEEERKINLFIRAKNIEEFANLRLKKDSWRG
ncbi:hydroxyacylglutathione hydrolase [Prochlorococcus sp. MIT 1307]|uniref:hydroxyacylglutathione hydrolase n=1 Tax=Prochlorococcus sp. MIT 1307 TaxID=3096219 RepID=UPI002A755029|nr:hydroxyacylglutathione hydrolase [Prochlorococcus sp. MIT 1307]